LKGGGYKKTHLSGRTRLGKACIYQGDILGGGEEWKVRCHLPNEKTKRTRKREREQVRTKKKIPSGERAYCGKIEGNYTKTGRKKIKIRSVSCEGK